MKKKVKNILGCYSDFVISIMSVTEIIFIIVFNN